MRFGRCLARHRQSGFVCRTTIGEVVRYLALDCGCCRHSRAVSALIIRPPFGRFRNALRPVLRDRQNHWISGGIVMSLLRQAVQYKSQCLELKRQSAALTFYYNRVRTIFFIGKNAPRLSFPQTINTIVVMPIRGGLDNQMSMFSLWTRCGSVFLEAEGY
jgi:hypothetical protein